MAIQDDFSVNYETKTIDHISGTTKWSVFEKDGDSTDNLYWFLMDLFDDAEQMDDDFPIKKNSPIDFAVINDWTITDTALSFLKGAAITMQDGTVWSSIYSIGSDDVISNITLYVVQNGAVVYTAPTAGHIDILLKTNDAGTLIDGGEVTVMAHEWGYEYSHFVMDMSEGGRQPAAIATKPDANNTTAEATVGAYNIDIAFGATTEDVDDSGVVENYTIEVGLNSAHSMAEAYEYLKYVCRRGETALLNGAQGQLYLSGAAGYAVVAVAPFGTFAGGKFFGAQGVFFTLAERQSTDANLYELIDADGNTGIKEPISAPITVSGLAAEYKLLVAPESGGSINKAQYTTTASGNDASATTVTITTAPWADTPATGYIRVNGLRYKYSSVAGSVFTLDATAHPTGLSEAANSVNAYVPWLDLDPVGAVSASVGVKYSADRDLICITRLKGILAPNITGTLTSAGFATTAIINIDPIV